MAINITIGSDIAETIENFVSSVNASGDSSLSNITVTDSSPSVDIEYDDVGLIGNEVTISSDNSNVIASSNLLSGGTGYDIDKMAFIKDNNIYNAIVFDSSTGHVSELQDYYGEKIKNNLGFLTSNTLTIEAHNKELHVGTGNVEGSSSKWIGKPQEISFYEENNLITIMVDAELVTPTGTDFFVKLVSDEEYLYGHRWKGSSVYKIKISTGVITKTSNTGAFKDLRSIDYYNNKLWVFDAGASEHGTVYRIDTGSMEINKTCPVADYSRVSNSYVSDMILTTNKLWISHSATVDTTDKMLLNTPVPTQSGAISFTDRTTSLSSAYWTLGVGSSVSGYYNFVYSAYSGMKFTKIKKRALCRVNSTNIGWGCEYNQVYNGGLSLIYAYSDTIVMSDGQDLNTIANLIRHKFTINVINEDYDRASRVKIYNINDPSTENSITSIFQDSNSFVFTSGNKIRKGDLLTSVSASTDIVVISSFTSASVQHDNENRTGFITESYTDDSTEYYVWFSYNVESVIKKILKSNLSSSDIMSNESIEVVINNITGGGKFPDGKTHDYRLSYTYDGYQESPMSEVTYTKTDTSGTTDNKTISITIPDITLLSKRVSHLNLYRSSDDGYYRLVKSLKADDPSWDIDSSDKNKYSVDIIDNYLSYRSFESRCGIPETMKTVYVNYGLSTQINNVIIVGDCFHTEIDDAENYLFKSKSYRFDTFNWAVDYLRLPEKPVAIKSFNGRVYAFSENRTYRINPDSLIIEDIFDGIGCISQNAIISTEFGLFYASSNNIYMHNGNQPTPIAEPILRDSANNLGWQDNTKTHVSLSFDEKRNSLLVFFTVGSNSYCWSFNLSRKRWDLLDAPKAVGVIIGKNSEINVADGTYIYEYMNGTGQRTWEYQSKSITLGVDTQDKMFYKLRGIGDSHTIEYKVYQGSSWSSSWQTLTNEKIASGDKKSKAIKIKITPASETSEIDSFGVIYRTLPIR